MPPPSVSFHSIPSSPFHSLAAPTVTSRRGVVFYRALARNYRETPSHDDASSFTARVSRLPPRTRVGLLCIRSDAQGTYEAMRGNFLLSGSADRLAVIVCCMSLSTTPDPDGCNRSNRPSTQDSTWSVGRSVCRRGKSAFFTPRSGGREGRHAPPSGWGLANRRYTLWCLCR
jgi:hypothetical protein